MRLHALALVLALAVPASALADQVELKTGGRLVGEVVERTPAIVVVAVGPGTVTVPATSVARIVESASPLEAFRERATRLADDDVRGWLDLAVWARDREIFTQARQAFERVLALDPGNALAHRALGDVRYRGQWMTPDESYRARGYVLFEGSWMTPAEQQAALAERRERREIEQAERARREAEERAAEAERRAREAEAAATQVEGVPLWAAYGVVTGGATVWPPAGGTVVRTRTRSVARQGSRSGACPTRRARPRAHRPPPAH